MANFSDASPLSDVQAVMENCSDNRPTMAHFSDSTSRSKAQLEMASFSDVSPLSDAQAMMGNCSDNRPAMENCSDSTLRSKAQFRSELELLRMQLVKKSVDVEVRSESKLLPMQLVEEKCIDDVNYDSICEILSRVPSPELVVRCKSVCSSWQELIEASSFVRAYNPGAIFHSCEKSDTNRFLYHLNFSYLDLRPEIGLRRLPTLDVKLYSDAFSRLVNGLMLLGTVFWPDHVNQLHIYNVFTKEQRLIPKVLGDSFGDRLTYHLGYSSKSNEYKVLRLAFQFENNPPLRAQILTIRPLGILSTWRHIEVPNLGIPSLTVYNMVRSHEAKTFSGNAVVSWFAKEGLIWFDFNQEQFRRVELPEDLADDHENDYGVFVRHGFNGGQGVAFFSLNDDMFYVLEDGDKWREECLEFPSGFDDKKMHLFDGKGSFSLLNKDEYNIGTIGTRADDGKMLINWEYDTVPVLHCLCRYGTCTTWDNVGPQSPSITLLHDSSAMFQSMDDMLSGCKLIETNPKEFSFEVLSKATNGFHFSRVLGSGACGIVYKAIFAESSALSTVKRSKHRHKGKGKLEYLNMIGCLRHRNLVQLQGWCIEKEELLLVYEFMARGSLDQLLFLESEDGNSPLKWPQRYNIAAGLASAVTYLHRKHVIHGGIKTSNIMLDVCDNASLGDLGWAMLINNDESPMGYLLAPEYLQNGTMTAETDVFSYGVVILELASGRRQSDKGVNLVDWIWELHSKGKITEAADNRLNGEFQAKEMKKLLLIGLSCANPVSDQRPTMRKFLEILASADELDPVPQQHSATDPT